MKPLKLLACLVTLPFTCGFPLKAADSQDLRQWTDAKGRSITARLIDAPDAASIKIERADGQVFTVPVATFSADDQAYVQAYRERAAHAARNPDMVTADGTVLKEPAAATWTLLNSGGSQPASVYTNTQLDQIIDLINQRFALKDVKTPAGQPLQIRTEPADLAARIRISGDLPRMGVDAFVREVARMNSLGVKVDPAGMVVLVDKTPPAKAKPSLDFLGVSMNAP